MNRKSRKLNDRRQFELARESSIDYQHRLSFYSVPPTQQLTADEFESWAIDRLRVLGEIESQAVRNVSQKDLEVRMRAMLDKLLPLNANSARGSKGDLLDYERRKDHCSHYILRLAFCRTKDLRNRFIHAEKALFRIRFATDTAAERQEFLNSLSFDWETVDQEERTQLHEELFSVHGRLSEKESFLKVDFERVANLVEGRRLYVRGGKAYVPTSAQLELVLLEFETQLARSLDLTNRALPSLDEDDRIVPIVVHLSHGFEVPQSTNSITASGDISADQVNGLVGHFPLCMRNQHLRLRHDKLLKHQSRYQYGLFLKGIGLNVEQALIFWRESFANIPNDTFNKKYRYYIRHSYGLEGGRKNYNPPSCKDIICGPAPGPGEAHGCPYKHFSMHNLLASLEGLGIRDSTVLNDVENDVNNRLYHVACTKVFEATHGENTLVESISHPNGFFERSFKLAKSNAKASSNSEVE